MKSIALQFTHFDPQADDVFSLFSLPPPVASSVSLSPPSLPRLGTYRNGPGCSGLACAGRARDEDIGPLHSRAEKRRSLFGGGHVVVLRVSKYLRFGMG